MNTLRSLAVGLVLSMTAISAAAAGPHTRLYDAIAGEDTIVDLSICSHVVDMEVIGDGGTDLDFYIYDSQGFEMYANESLADWMSGTFTQDYSGCVDYELHVFNNGHWNNRFVVRLTDL